MTRSLQFEDLMKIRRLSGAAVSPDGRKLVFVAATHDHVENKVRRTLWMADHHAKTEVELTPGPGNHHSPAFSPDGRHLAFVSSRDGESQLWLLPTAGGEARRLTNGVGGSSQPVWSPDGTRIAFARQVVVSPHLRTNQVESVEPTQAQVYGLVNPKSSARLETALLYRHWDGWRSMRRNHIFIVDVETGDMVDLTPGDHDAPPIALETGRDFAFSPDGTQLAFAMNPDQEVARSTNNAIWLLPLMGVDPAGEARCVSINEAWDGAPTFSPNGRYLAWLGMDKPVHEADKTRVRLLDLQSGEVTTYLDAFDRSPHELAWQGDDLVFIAQDRGRQSVYRLSLPSGAIRQLTLGTHNSGLLPVPGSQALIVGRQSASEPLDYFLLLPGEGIEPFLGSGPLPADLPADAGARSMRLTNSRRGVADLTLNPLEEFWYRGADDTPLHGYLLKPPGFDPDKTYPLVLLIHGGPQGAFSDDFHYRWNYQMFAARGAVVATVNPRGSTGYGQQLTDQISGDWGGRAYVDVMNGVDAILAQFPFVDPDRLGAAGASFGGFMVNWILGHSDRFKALVSHDGIFNSENMAYTTEELWFEEVEHGGLPHVHRASHQAFSPHLFVDNFKTPTLVIHGEQDFRCPISEGMGLFTALQVKGVPSKFLYFPDEGHWVMNPANAHVWYHEVVGWLMGWLEAPHRS
ncbi:MAG: S9 family peptidase [Deltaproteobacteria bacterium]|nr:S9 family peptidase [Deltaproteobacteria bacterium]